MNRIVCVGLSNSFIRFVLFCLQFFNVFVVVCAFSTKPKHTHSTCTHQTIRMAKMLGGFFFCEIWKSFSEKFLENWIDLNDNTMQCYMNCYVTKRYTIQIKIYLNSDKTVALLSNPILSIQICALCSLGLICTERRKGNKTTNSKRNEFRIQARKVTR